MAQLSAGSKAPDFKLAGNDGKTHSLASARGKKLVIFFYPKDNTPGCTLEACDFRDNLARLEAAGASVLGVSRDSLASHDKFRDKYELNYPLLCDADGRMHEAYGTWGEKVNYGRTYFGTIRSTFVIDEKGTVSAAFYGVKVKGHVDAVLAALGGTAAPQAPSPKAPAKKAVSKKVPAPKAVSKKAPAKKAAAKAKPTK